MASNEKMKLKAGLIGCGRIGAFTGDELRNTIAPGWLPLNHAEAIKTNEDIKLIALADINDERLERAKIKYHVSKTYHKYRELIGEIKPDILSIATRTEERCDIIEFAAMNGVKGIHFEKPISTNMKDCNRAIDAILANDVKISYGTTRRFMDIYRKAKEIIRSGDIGDIIQIAVEMGRAPLLWTHPHSVDLLLFFSDAKTKEDIEYVQANCLIKDSGNGKKVDSDPLIEFAFVKFNNGINGIITSAGGMNTIIDGTKGKIVIAADGSSMGIYKKSKSRPYYQNINRTESKPHMSGTQRAFYEIVNSIRNNLKSPIDPREIALNQQILLSFVVSSMNGGTKMKLHALEDDFTVTGRTGTLYP